MPDGSASDLPLLILCLPSADKVPGAQALAGISAQGRILETVGMAEAELAAGSTARLVVLCPMPEVWLALALATEAAPSQAVSAWRDAVRPLMGLLRARRRQTRLLFDHTFASNPAACAAALGLPAPESPDALRPSDDPVLVMIAREALREDPAAQALAEELMATAVTPSGAEGTGEQGLDAIFESYVTRRQQQAAIEAGQAALTARVQALEAEAAELHARQAAEAQAAATALATERSQAAATDASIRAALAEAQTEASLLRDQIQLDRAALEQSQTALVAEQEARQNAEAGQVEALARVRMLEAESQVAAAALVAERSQAAATEASLRAALAEAQTEASLLRDQIRLDGSFMDQMQASLAAEQEARQNAEAGQAALTARVQALEAEAQAAAAALATERSQAAATEVDIRAALGAEQAARQTAEAKKGALDLRVKALVAEITELRVTLQARAKAAEENLASERSRAAAAEAAIRTALEAEQSARQATEAKQAALATQLQILETEAGLLRDQIRLDGSVMDEMQAALSVERQQITALQAAQEAAETQAQSRIEAERAARLKAEADLGEMIRQLQAQVQQAGQELEAYLVQVETLQSERSALLAQIAQLRAARADLEGYYDQAKQVSDQVDMLTTDLGGLQQALKIAQAEAAERGQHVAWLEGEISRIYRSRSYRLTTPLRKLRTSIGGTGDNA